MRRTLAAVGFLTATSVAALAAGSVSDVLQANKAAMGGKVWDAKTAVRIDTDFNGMGLTGTTSNLADLKKGFSVGTFKAGPIEGANGFDGKKPWERDPSGTVNEQEGGEAMELAINDAYRTANGWWKPGYDGAAITGEGEKSDTSGNFDVLTVTPKGGKAFEAWFDAKTHLLAKTVEKHGAQTVTTSFSDYGKEGGIQLAHKIVVDNGLGEKYQQVMKVTKVTFLGKQAPDAFAMPTTQLRDFEIAGGAASTTVPFQLVNNHIYGAAKVNGRGPYTFIFDTGGRNIITPTLAKEMGVNAEGAIAGTGAGEGVTEAGFAKGLTFQVGDAAVKDKVAMVFPLENFSEIEGIPMPGMIGYETFNRFVTRIDYGAGTLTLIDPAKFDPKDAGTPVKFLFNGSVPEVMGSIEGIPAKFDIDTGSRAELTITKPFAVNNKLREKHPKGVDAVEGWGVGGPSLGYVTRIKDVVIGDVKIGDVVGSLVTQDKGAFAGSDYSANVGGGILKRFVVTFDYGNKIMYLKPLAEKASDTGTYDRAGIWINVTGAGFKIVAVTKTSPAEEAGLKEGDVITAVDGTPAASLKLPDLRKRLRNDAPGTVMTLKILRDGQSEDVKVTLRDLI